jgi:hypothetical protein
MGKAPKGWEFADAGGRRRPVRTGVSSSPPGKRRLRIKAVSQDRIIQIWFAGKES